MKNINATLRSILHIVGPLTEEQLSDIKKLLKGSE